MVFLDSDRVIEEKEGRAIRDIFAQDGEAYFRDLECKFAQMGHPKRGCVVSCGGGMVVPDYVRDLLKERGVVVVLHASVDVILERVSEEGHRPLLEGEDRRERIEALLQSRQGAYADAGEVVRTDGLTVNEVVRRVIGIYRLNEPNFPL